MRSKWFVALSVLIFAGCQNLADKTPSGNQQVIPELRTGKPTTNAGVAEKKYAFIRKIESRDGKNYLQADYADYLTGEKALQKARAAGDAHYVIGKMGDTSYSLMDGYYISNTSTALRTIELSDALSIEVVDYAAGSTAKKNVTLSELKALLKNDPLMILSISDGRITAMKEQYRP